MNQQNILIPISIKTSDVVRVRWLQTYYVFRVQLLVPFLKHLPPLIRMVCSQKCCYQILIQVEPSLSDALKLAMQFFSSVMINPIRVFRSQLKGSLDTHILLV